VYENVHFFAPIAVLVKGLFQIATKSPKKPSLKEDVFTMKRSFSIPSQFYNELQRLDTKQKAEIFSALIDFAQNYPKNCAENCSENSQIAEKLEPKDPACGVLFRLITAKNVRKTKSKAEVQAKAKTKLENTAKSIENPEKSEKLKSTESAEKSEKTEAQAVSEEKPLRFRAENPLAQKPVQNSAPEFPKKSEQFSSKNANNNYKIKGVSNEYLDSLFSHT
jgi:hypothetical protein